MPKEHGERFADEYRKMFPRQQVTLETDEEEGRVLMHTKPGLTTKQLGKWTDRWHQLSRELRLE